MAVSSSSSRPPSVIWSLRSNSTGAIANDKRASFTARDSSKVTANQPRARSSSFINISSSYVLEENLFTQNSRNRKVHSIDTAKVLIDSSVFVLVTLGCIHSRSGYSLFHSRNPKEKKNAHNIHFLWCIFVYLQHTKLHTPVLQQSDFFI